MQTCSCEESYAIDRIDHEYMVPKESERERENEKERERERKREREKERERENEKERKRKRKRLRKLRKPSVAHSYHQNCIINI